MGNIEIRLLPLLWVLWLGVTLVVGLYIFSTATSTTAEESTLPSVAIYQPDPITKPIEVWSVMKGGECYAYRVGDVEFIHTCHSTYKQAHTEMQDRREILRDIMAMRETVWEDVVEVTP